MTAERNPIRAVLMLVATATLPLVLLAASAGAQTTGTMVEEPASFTSNFSVRATADEVPEGEDGRRGEPGATGTFGLRLASEQEIICYDITLRGVTPPFESPAPTATHIHDGDPGVVGPPVVLFPNPEMSSDGALQTSGCLQEPFTSDASAQGFSLANIEASPTGFYVDNHTAQFVPGAVRGQLGAPLPSGGVATGAGGTAGGSGASWAVIVAIMVTGLAGAALAGQALSRRRRAGSAS
ncbi:MAG: CHRD domain-containing protein [Egibacteraceae bacterium]